MRPESPRFGRHVRVPPWRLLLRYSAGVRGRVVVGGLLTFVGTMIGLSQPLLAQLVLVALTYHRPVALLLIILTSVVVLGAILLAVGFYLLEYAGETVVLNMRVRLAQKILRLRISVTNEIPPGDLMSRLVSDTTLLRQITTQGLVSATTGIISLIGTLVLMGVLDWVLLLVTLTSVAIMTVTIRWSARQIGKATGQAQAAVAGMAMLLDRSLGAFRTVKAAGAETGEIERMTDAAKGAWRLGLRLARWQAASGTTAILTMQVSFLVVLGVGGARVAAGRIPISTLIAFMLFMLYLGQPINALSSAYGQYQAGTAAAIRVEEILSLEAEPSERPQAERGQSRRQIWARIRGRRSAAQQDERPGATAGRRPTGAQRDRSAGAQRERSEGALGERSGAVPISRMRTTPRMTPPPSYRRPSYQPPSYQPTTFDYWGVPGQWPGQVLPDGQAAGNNGYAYVDGYGYPSDGYCASEIELRCASVEFQNVTFAYSRATSRVHHGVTFSVPPGGMTAVVGPSGAGKSTLFALIERFYDVNSGKVLVDGCDVREWPLGQLRASIGYVEQDTPALAGTLRENLTLGLGKIPDEQLREVLAMARLEEFVAALPKGLDADIGYRGGSLSGGERQRMAIARALLRSPRLLLLDEATSQLDAANEFALRESITAAAATTTVMVVAHRLSTVVGARKIVVMEAGRVRSCGTHEQLLHIDPLYRDLATTQLLAAPTS